MKEGAIDGVDERMLRGQPGQVSIARTDKKNEKRFSSLRREGRKRKGVGVMVERKKNQLGRGPLSVGPAD